jgi:hypothetical protein
MRAMSVAVLTAAAVGDCIKPMLRTGALGDWVIELLMCCPDAGVKHINMNSCACGVQRGETVASTTGSCYLALVKP